MKLKGSTEYKLSWEDVVDIIYVENVFITSQRIQLLVIRILDVYKDFIF